MLNTCSLFGIEMIQFKRLDTQRASEPGVSRFYSAVCVVSRDEDGGGGGEVRAALVCREGQRSRTVH